MFQELKEVALDKRDEIRLYYTSGTIHVYKGANLPELLARPLIYNPNGQIPAFSSGGRGALVKCGKWFKYKGVRPQPNKVYEETGEPLGGMTKKKAIRELEANELVNMGYEKYGYKGPSIPAAYIEYDIPFNEENVCCAISQTFGDTRVTNMFGVKFSQALKEHDKTLCEFFTKVDEWVGLADRVLKEKGVTVSKYSSDVGNFVFFKLRDGYGIGPVDLSSSELNMGKTRKSTIFWQLDLFRFGAFFGDPPFHNRIEEKYLSAFEGKTIPKPIDEKLVVRFVG